MEDGIPNRGAAYAKTRCETVDRSRPFFVFKGTDGILQGWVLYDYPTVPSMCSTGSLYLAEGPRECLYQMILRRL